LRGRHLQRLTGDADKDSLPAPHDAMLDTFEGIFEQLYAQMHAPAGSNGGGNGNGNGSGGVSMDVLAHVKRCLLASEPTTRETAAQRISELFGGPASLAVASPSPSPSHRSAQAGTGAEHRPDDGADADPVSSASQSADSADGGVGGSASARPSFLTRIFAANDATSSSSAPPQPPPPSLLSCHAPRDGDDVGLMLVAAFCEAAYFDEAWARRCLRLIEQVARVSSVNRTWKSLLELYRCVPFKLIH
jgi:hypothetical protein